MDMSKATGLPVVASVMQYDVMDREGGNKSWFNTPEDVEDIKDRLTWRQDDEWPACGCTEEQREECDNVYCWHPVLIKDGYSERYMMDFVPPYLYNRVVLEEAEKEQ